MDCLEKHFKFKTFPDAVQFVNQVAGLAERVNHHPDINLKYNLVTLTFYTHTANAVTGKDEQLAAECEKLYANFNVNK